MRKAVFAAFNRIWSPTPAAGREGATWRLLSPWCNSPNTEGEQEITPESTAAMIAALNAKDDKMGGKWPGMPIYEDHPDTIDPAIAQRMGWTNKARIGHFWRAEAKDDGLYVLQAWNEQGAHNAANSIRSYPSAYWYIKAKGNKIVPTGFRSIGMTEEPNIKGVSAWNTSAEADDGDGADDEPTDPNTAMIKKIAELLGMEKPETATQESVEAAIGILTAGATTAAANNAAVNTVSGQLTTEKQRADAEKQRADKAVADLAAAQTGITAEKAALNTRILGITLDRAIETGRITKGQRKQWEDRAALNAETTLVEVLRLRPGMNLGTLQLDRTVQVKAALNSAAAQREINALAKAAKAKHGGNIQAAYNAVRADPANAKLVAAADGSAEPAAADGSAEPAAS